MGYVPKKKTYDLDFTGTEYDGLEITVNDMTTDEVISMPNENTLEATAKSFAGQLVSWNIETAAGKPVPPTLANVLKQDRSMTKAIVMVWLDTQNGVPTGPLQPSSPDGEPSPAASIPMEPLS